jgi:hypothetical protein
VLPGRSWFAKQLDTGPSQLFHGCWQVADGEAGDWPGGEVFLAWVAAAENLDMAAIAKLEDPEIRFGMHQPKTKNVFVEVGQFPGVIGARTTPAKACDLHARQYHGFRVAA